MTITPADMWMVPSHLTLVKSPDPILRQVSKVVGEDEFGPELQKFADQLSTTMFTEEGVGLAAVQVGVLQRVLVLIANGTVLQMVNPTIKSASRLRIEHTEKCLSYPGIRKKTNRSRQVVVTYRTPLGQTCTHTFLGFDAIVVQHEMDHLDGKTIG